MRGHCSYNSQERAAKQAVLAVTEVVCIHCHLLLPSVVNVAGIIDGGRY